MARTAVQTFIDVVSGVKQQIKASLTGGAAAAYTIPSLGPTGQLDLTHMPTGVGPDTQVLPATEAIVAGAYVNIWSNAGVMSIRNADASAAAPGKPADGFVMAAVAVGANGTVFSAGQNSSVSGQTLGAVYLSDTSPGSTMAAAPTTSGHLVQYLGKAVAVANIATSIDPSPIFLA